MGIEMVPAPFQFSAQFEIVIDFSVEDRPHRVVFIVDGLLATGNIDDAQPAHAQTNRAPNIQTFIVRSAVHNRLAHAVYVRGFDRFPVSAYDARYPAHDSASAAGCSDSISRAMAGLRPRTAIGTSPTVKSCSPQLSNQRNTCSYVCFD